MRRCAFLTMSNPEGFFVYDQLVFQPMADRGWAVEEIPWTEQTDWNKYDLVVIRSTWDYQNDYDRFLNVLREIDTSKARLENSLDIVRWNIYKRYLRDLSQRGVPIVPTIWKSSLSRDEIAAAQVEFGEEKLIAKPVIGANADDTFRLGVNELETNAALEVFKQRELMLQPFVPSIQTEGEYSLFYFGGEYSHCILKSPAADDFRVQEEHGGSLASAIASDAMKETADQAVKAVGSELLYARVDLVRTQNTIQGFALMELELIEPSLYFPYDDESPTRFADAVERIW